MRQLPPLLSVVLASALLAAPAVAQVTIDDLQTAQGPETSSPGATNASNVSGGGNVVVGDSRDLVAFRGIGSGNTSVEVTGGEVVFTSEAGADGLARLGYDANADGFAVGVDPDGIDPPVDLTDGGTAEAVLFTVEAASGGPLLTVQVWSNDASTSSSWEVELPETATPIDYAVPFSLFTRTSGASAAADFSAISAISITLEGEDVAATLSGPLATGAATPRISVTKVDLDDFSTAGGTDIGGGFVDPGDTITYRIRVRNTGGEATDVTVEDLLDPNLMQSLPEDVRISPLAFPDVYQDHCGNTTLQVDGAGTEGLLANDVDLDDSPPASTNLTITAVQGMAVPGGPFGTDQGGEVSSVDAATGTFDYDPPAGFNGIDTFTYTVTDDEGQTGSGRVSIEVADLVWFVDNAHGGDNLGTQADPFQSLAEVSGAGGVGDPDEPGQLIFVFENGGGDYEGIELEDDQRLIGEAHGLSECVRTAIPAGERPVLSPASGDAVLLASGNTIRGLELGDTAAASAALADNGASVGTLTVSDVAISGAGGALDLRNGGTLDVTLNGIASTQSDATNGGVVLQNMGGSLEVTSGGGVETAISGAVDGIVVESSVAGSSFDFGDATVAAGAQAVRFVGNSATSTLTFGDLDASGSGVVGSGGGTFVIANADSTILNAPQALDLDGVDLGEGWTFADVTSTGSGRAIELDAIDDPVTITAGTLTKAGTVPAIDIDGGSSDFSYGGSVGQSGSGPTVRIHDRTGGTHTFGGAVTGTMGGGVVLTSNAGAGIDFTGGLSLQTGVNIAFQATGGGTIHVDSAAVTTLLAVNGAAHALDLDAVTLGAGHVTFDSITATGPTAEGLDLDGVTGAGSFLGGAVTISGGSGTGIDISGSSATFGFTSATVDDTAAHGIHLDGGNGPVTFGTVDVDGTTGSGIRVSGNTNPVTVNGGAIGATTDAGNASNAAFRVTGGSANVTSAAAVTNSSVGKAVEVSGRAGGTVQISGALNHSAGGAVGVHVHGNTGGATSFTAGTKTLASTTASGALLADNSGHIVAFTNGGLDVDTTSGAGFVASGGGTVDVTGAGNSVTTTAGRALDIDGVTTDVTLATVSSTAAGSRGIELTNLAAMSSFAVTGTTTVTASGAGGGGIDGSIHVDTSGAGSTISFGTTNVNMRADTGVFVDNAQGTVEFGTLSIPNPSGAGGNALHLEDSAAAFTIQSAAIDSTVVTSAQTFVDVLPGIEERFLPVRGGDGDAVFLAGLTGGFALLGGTIRDVGDNAVDVFGSSGVRIENVAIEDGPDGNSHSTVNTSIQATTSSDLTIRSVSISDFGNEVAAATTIRESAMAFRDLSGFARVLGTTVDTGTGFVFERLAQLPENLGLELDNRGVDLVLTIAGSTFRDIDFQGIQARHFDGDLSLVIDGAGPDGANTFERINGAAIDFGQTAADSGGSIGNYFLVDNDFTDVGISSRTGMLETATMNLTIADNTVTRTFSDALRIRGFGGAQPSTLRARVTDNLFADVGLALSTIGGQNPGAGNGLEMLLEKRTTARVLYEGNTVDDVVDNGGSLGANIANNAMGDLDLVFVDNDVLGVGSSAFADVQLMTNNGTGISAGAAATCLALTGNDTTGDASLFADYSFDTMGSGSMLTVENYVAPASDCLGGTSVDPHVAATNTTNNFCAVFEGGTPTAVDPMPGGADLCLRPPTPDSIAAAGGTVVDAPTTLQVEVQEMAVGLAHVPVRFTATTVGGATAAFPAGHVAHTDGSGIATVAVVSNGTPGTFSVSAETVPPTGSPVVFTVTNP